MSLKGKEKQITSRRRKEATWIYLLYDEARFPPANHLRQSSASCRAGSRLSDERSQNKRRAIISNRPVVLFEKRKRV